MSIHERTIQIQHHSIIRCKWAIAFILIYLGEMVETAEMAEMVEMVLPIPREADLQMVETDPTAQTELLVVVAGGRDAAQPTC